MILADLPGRDEKLLRDQRIAPPSSRCKFNSESYQFLKHGAQSLLMSTVAQPKDPRREQLRRQAILRRQQVFERISATRMLISGSVVAATCVMVGYMDASAHTTSSSTTSGTGSSLGSSGSGSGSYGDNGYGGGSSNYGSSSSSGGSSSSGQSSSGSGQSDSGSSGSGQSLLGGGSPPSSSSGSGGVVSGGS